MIMHEHEGSCFCGAVQLRVQGEPAASGYCHCASCRAWAAAPVNAFTLWPRGAVTIVRGADKLDAYSKNPTSVRKWCRECGGHVLTDHPAWEVTDVYAATLPTLPFRAQLHVNYAESVLPMRDGLPKQRDMPSEMGGSGVLLPE
jgi:hypothetical protein